MLSNKTTMLLTQYLSKNMKNLILLLSIFLSIITFYCGRKLISAHVQCWTDNFT